jgi:hydrogenase/urease accessory protein HupE
MLFVLCFFMATPVSAHEVRPAFLQITERANGHYDVLWKQPTMGEVAVRLEPHISGGLLDKQPTAIEAGQGFLLRAWRDLDAGPTGMEGRTVHIEGLDRTITDVLVSITLANGDVSQQLVRPEDPTLTLRLRGSGVAVPAYLMLGVEHILTGIDHLCFVLGLVLLVRNRRMLIATITAFTVAHSITLAGTALNVIAPRPAMIEALVALSIVFVAVELVHSYRGRAALTVRYPWVIAFTFGLLHGAAFASALAQIGLPPNAVPLSLLLFNVGVEVGQLLFVVAVLGMGWVLMRLPRRLPQWTRWVPPYAIGSFATVWFIQRLGAAVVG